MRKENDDMPEWERQALKEMEYNRTVQRTPNAPKAVINAAYRNKHSDKPVISEDDITNLKIDLGLTDDFNEFLYKISYNEFGRSARRTVDAAERQALYGSQSARNY